MEIIMEIVLWELIAISQIALIVGLIGAYYFFED